MEKIADHHLESIILKACRFNYWKKPLLGNRCLFIFSVCVIFMIQSCVEPFTVVSQDYEKLLVIEGRITDEPGIHVVKVSYTRPIEETRPIPLTGANVRVEGTDGSLIKFEESTSGQYLSQEGAAAKVGVSYQLVVTHEERIYESSLQELIGSPPIDNIYHEYSELIVDDTKEVRPGIQILIDTKDDGNKAKHFRYEWEETYEVRPPYPSLYQFSSNPDTLFLRNELIHVCYVTDRSSAIILGSTANLSDSKLTGMEVRYITSATDQLKFTYSILVTQYAISAEAYNFYRLMNERSVGGGSLYSNQLGALVGNIHSLNDESEVVLGFFEVAGKQQKRQFFRYELLDPRFPSPDDQQTCSPLQIKFIEELGPPYGISDSVRYYVQEKGLEVVDALYCDSTRNINVACEFYMRAILAPRYCADCRYRGTTQKPRYWIF